MKSTKFWEEISAKSSTELQEESRKIAEELMKTRVRKNSGQHDNSHRIAVLRKNFARIKTRLTALARGTTAA